MLTNDDLFALLRRHGRRLPVRRVGDRVCGSCGDFLPPGVLRCKAHPEAEVQLELLDEEDTHASPGNLCPVCGALMYAVQVEENVYALPCFHWLYAGKGDKGAT